MGGDFERLYCRRCCCQCLPFGRVGPLVTAATVLTLLAARAMITFAQLDPSAQAPWTSTTVASFAVILLLPTSRLCVAPRQPTSPSGRSRPANLPGRNGSRDRHFRLRRPASGVGSGLRLVHQ